MTAVWEGPLLVAFFERTSVARRSFGPGDPGGWENDLAALELLRSDLDGTLERLRQGIRQREPTVGAPDRSLDRLRNCDTLFDRWLATGDLAVGPRDCPRLEAIQRGAPFEALRIQKVAALSDADDDEAWRRLRALILLPIEDTRLQRQ